MKRVDLSNIKEAGESTRLPAGVYICKITAAEDVPEKEYLKISYDIAKGEFAGYYAEIRENHPDWNVGVYYRSYKPRALPMFKRMCSAVSKSNGNFVFDGGMVNADESTLVGKLIGITLQEEEYYANDGNKKTRLVVYREFPVDKIGEQRVPAPKLLKVEEAPNDFMPTTSTSEEEIPWS